MRCERYLGLGSLLLTLAGGISSDEAGAATATTTFQVTANVQVNCLIQATNMPFGNYNQIPVKRTSIILVNCTKTAQWTIGLDAGTAPGATVTARQMTGPAGNFLNYSLFTDPANTINWGNTPGTDTVSGVGTGDTQFVQVFGSLPGLQNAAAGGYVDTITATITF